MQTINTKTGSSADSKFHIMELLDYHVLDNFSRLGFLIRRIAAVGFFRYLLFYSTLAAFLILVISYSAVPDLEPDSVVHYVWRRASFVGFWTTCTASAGILGMARTQGVLESTITSPRGGLLAIYSMVAPVTIFASLAFLISWLFTSAWTATLLEIYLQDIFMFLLMGISAFAITIPVACIFLLTKHANTYEQFILFPILFLSGVFLQHAEIHLEFWRIFLIPLSLPLHFFIFRIPIADIDSLSWVIFSVSIVAWLLLGLLLYNRISQMVLRTGTLYLR